MTKSEKKYISSVIANEGFDYTFIHYSNFEEVKDKKFQELRNAYVSARKEFHAFLDEQGVDFDL